MTKIAAKNVIAKQREPLRDEASDPVGAGTSEERSDEAIQDIRVRLDFFLQSTDLNVFVLDCRVGRKTPSSQ